MIQRICNRQFLGVVALLAAVVLSCSSCETLKKKFTRKKKAGQNPASEFQPVLEPMEYPAPDKNTKEIYKQHYALIKTWYKDLWSGINERTSDAMVKYSMKQIEEHIEKMRVLLSPKKSADLDGLKAHLVFYKTSLDQQRVSRNYSRIQSDLRAFDRMLRAKFRIDAVTGDLVGQ